MNREKLLKQAEVLAVERRPEACLGCGFEHSCSTRGCAVIRTLIELARAEKANGPQEQEEPATEIERLTDKCWRNLDPWECCGQKNYCLHSCHTKGGCTNGCIVPKLYRRLAEYEDAGLEPAEEKLAVAALMGRELAQIKENAPLTMEELKEYLSKGDPYEIEPLYIVFDPTMQADFAQRWRDAFNLSQMVEHCAETYGEMWTVYRRKTEDAQ